MRLRKGDTVVAVAGEEGGHSPSTSWPMRVIIRNKKGGLREEVLQSDDQVKDLRVFYSVSAALNKTLIRLVEVHYTQKVKS